MEEIKPIYKFNSGMGGMICNGCRIIISTGPKTEELFCDKCKEECETEICTACQIYAAKKGSNHCSSCGPLIRQLFDEMKKDKKLGLYDEIIDVVNRQGEISEGDMPSIIDFTGPTKHTESDIEYVEWDHKKQSWEKSNK